jgi:hypothetical protein
MGGEYFQGVSLHRQPIFLCSQLRKEKYEKKECFYLSVCRMGSLSVSVINHLKTLNIGNSLR